jgi:hypothetical protein
MNIANEIINLQSSLYSRRSVTESVWQEISNVLLPRQNYFWNKNVTPGQKNTEFIITAMAQEALNKFAAAYESVTAPRSIQWHGLTVANQELADVHEVQVYLDEVTDILFNARYGSKSNFSSQNHECNISLGAFGTGIMMTEDNGLGNVIYKSGFIGEFFIMDNQHGIIDYVIRKYKRTARQAYQRFGDKLPAKIIKASTEQPDEYFEFLHCVKPNEDRKRGETDYKGMKYSSYHVSVEESALIEEGGYRTFPFHFNRYVTAPNEIWGRGPGWTALSEIKMVNEMRKDALRANHMSTLPPMMVSDERGLRNLNLTPGALNFGALDEVGRPRVVPFQLGDRPDVQRMSLESSYQLINEIFLVTLFQVMVDTPSMTATEVLQRAQEKGSLLAPTAGRAQSEYFSSIIEREIDIMNFHELLPPMPDIMVEFGAEYEIEYLAPINIMQRAEEATSITRLVQAAMPIAQFNPSILEKFNWDEYINMLAKAYGAPAKIMYSDEQMQAMNEQKQQQEMMQQMMQAAPSVTQSMKNVAETQKIAGLI